MSLRDESVYRTRIGKAATKAKAMIRRLTVGITSSSGLWQLFGLAGLAGFSDRLGGHRTLATHADPTTALDCSGDLA